MDAGPQPAGVRREAPARRSGALRPTRWHPAFAHFPLACWLLATLFDVAAAANVPPFPVEWGVPDATAVSTLLLWLGLAAALPAVGFGLVDYARLPAAARDSPEMQYHVACMGAAAAIFLIAALLRVAENAWGPGGLAALEAAGALCLIAGGHFAGIVVFERLPEAAASTSIPGPDGNGQASTGL